MLLLAVPLGGSGSLGWLLISNAARERGCLFDPASPDRRGVSIERLGARPLSAWVCIAAVTEIAGALGGIELVEQLADRLPERIDGSGSG